MKSASLDFRDVALVRTLSVADPSLPFRRKLEQEHKEKLAAVRSELMGEMDQLQQQASQQREQLEAEVQKIREDESFLRDHLSISVKVQKKKPSRWLVVVSSTFYFSPSVKRGLTVVHPHLVFHRKTDGLNWSYWTAQRN